MFVFCSLFKMHIHEIFSKNIINKLLKNQINKKKYLSYKKMLNQEETTDSLYGKSKMHNIPIDHLDFKYVEKCNDIKELEKIYKVLA